MWASISQCSEKSLERASYKTFCVLWVLGWGLLLHLVSDIYEILYSFLTFFFFSFFVCSPPSLLFSWPTCLSLAVFTNNCSAGKCLVQECFRSSGWWLKSPQESVFSTVIAQWQLRVCFQRRITLSCIIAGRWRAWF